MISNFIVFSVISHLFFHTLKKDSKNLHSSRSLFRKYLGCSNFQIWIYIGKKGVEKELHTPIFRNSNTIWFFFIFYIIRIGCVALLWHFAFAKCKSWKYNIANFTLWIITFLTLHIENVKEEQHNHEKIGQIGVACRLTLTM